MAPAAAHHVAPELDTALPWAALPGDGYLDFMRPERPIRIAPEPGSRALGVSGIFREDSKAATALTSSAAKNSGQNRISRI